MSLTVKLDSIFNTGSKFLDFDLDLVKNDRIDQWMTLNEPLKDFYLSLLLATSAQHAKSTLNSLELHLKYAQTQIFPSAKFLFHVNYLQLSN